MAYPIADIGIFGFSRETLRIFSKFVTAINSIGTFLQ